ncbi:MAG TPA: hypothetical protein VGL48_18655 [Acidimicrobiales bacterium]
MRSWLALKLVSRNMAQMRAGNIAPTLKLDTDDVRFRFPGVNSWAGDFTGKVALEDWYGRFVRVGLRPYADEAVVKGWPWKMTIAVRGHIDLPGPEGSSVYDNRFVIWGCLRWGRMADYEVYEDTQKSAALDVYLEEHEPAA